MQPPHTRTGTIYLEQISGLVVAHGPPQCWKCEEVFEVGENVIVFQFAAINRLHVECYNDFVVALFQFNLMLDEMKIFTTEIN